MSPATSESTANHSLYSLTTDRGIEDSMYNFGPIVYERSDPYQVPAHACVYIDREMESGIDDFDSMVYGKTNLYISDPNPAPTRASVPVDEGMGNGIDDFDPMIYGRNNSYVPDSNPAPIRANIPVDRGMAINRRMESGMYDFDPMVYGKNNSCISNPNQISTYANALIEREIRNFTNDLDSGVYGTSYSFVSHSTTIGVLIQESCENTIDPAMTRTLTAYGDGRDGMLLDKTG